MIVARVFILVALLAIYSFVVGALTYAITGGDSHPIGDAVCGCFLGVTLLCAAAVINRGERP